MSVIVINDYSEKQLALADKRRRNGDYIGALNILNWLNEKSGKKHEVYLQFAKVYMDIDMVNVALRYWFKFLSICPYSMRAEAYNGIACANFLLENYEIAGYYYDLHFSLDPDGDYDYLDEKLDYFDYISAPYIPEFYISHPIEKMPSDKKIELAERSFFEGKEQDSIELLKTVPDSDENYIGARLRMAAYYIVNEKQSVAEDIINGLIDRFPDDPLPHINKLVLMCDEGNIDEAKKAYYKLEDFDLKSFQECYKVAISLMDIKEDKLALYYALKANKDDPYSVRGLFLLGAIYYNLKDYETSYNYLLKVYQLSGLDVIKYYLDFARDPKIKNAPQRMSYELRYPSEKTKKLIAKAIRFFQNPTELKGKSLQSMLSLCRWLYSFPNNIQADLAKALISTKNRKIIAFFEELLLNPEVENPVKIDIIDRFLLQDMDAKLNATFAGIYFKFKLIPYPEIQKGDANYIIKQAYCLAFSRASALYKANLKSVKQAAQLIDARLNLNGNLEKIDDINALAAAMIAMSDNLFAKETGLLASYFGTDRKKIKETLKLIEAKHEGS